MKVWFLIAKVILCIFLAIFLFWLAMARASSHIVPASTYLWLKSWILALITALIILQIWEWKRNRKG